MKQIIELSALIIMFAFTISMVSMAIYGKGALMYYYEPNKTVWSVETILGLFAVIVGLVMIYEKIGSVK